MRIGSVILILDNLAAHVLDLEPGRVVFRNNLSDRRGRSVSVSHGVSADFS